LSRRYGTGGDVEGTTLLPLAEQSESRGVEGGFGYRSFGRRARHIDRLTRPDRPVEGHQTSRKPRCPSYVSCNCEPIKVCSNWNSWPTVTDRATATWHYRACVSALSAYTFRAISRRYSTRRSIAVAEIHYSLSSPDIARRHLGNVCRRSSSGTIENY